MGFLLRPDRLCRKETTIVQPGRIRGTGFTLIELLVVIAVIAILAGIMFPLFAQIRERARTTRCLGNVRNIQMAHLMYAQDFDEILPPYVLRRCPPEETYPGQGPLDVVLFTEYLQPYVKDRQVFFCPSATAEEDPRRRLWGVNYSRTVRVADYALATWGPNGTGTQRSPYWRWPGTVISSAHLPGGGCGDPLPACDAESPPCIDLMPLARLVRPAETISYRDGDTSIAPPLWISYTGFARHDKAGSVAGRLPAEWNPESGIVVGFIDGHSKFMRLKDAHAVVNDNGFWRYQYISADR
jgi:prepilin-type N-terminal cleavage/methylation domain-containing protein